MKFIKLFHLALLFTALAMFPSCGGDDGEEPEEMSCADDVKGIWNVTDQIPTSAGCTLVTYEIGTGTDDNILSIEINDGTRVYSVNRFN